MNPSATNEMWLEGSMKTAPGAILSLAIAMGGLFCSAQDATIPFRQIERDAQLSARLTVPADNAAISRAYSLPSESSPAAGFVFVPRATAPPKTLSSGFLFISGLHLGMSGLDIAMTQHCIADYHCREANPLMPSSLAGQLGVDFAYFGYGTFVSYRLKKRGNQLWLLSPTVGIAAHAVGVASGFAHY
jgi:hypothetical protein